MFYIDQKTPAFLLAKQEHYTNIRYVIKKKLLGKQFKEVHPKGIAQRIDRVAGISSRVVHFMNDEDNLRKILIGTPDVLDTLKSTFTQKKDVDSIKLLIKYDAFIDKSKETTFRFYNAFHLSESLCLNTCVYCNRLYTHTVITENREFVARPTFDHWFPKAAFPLLALSFHNLIPSCSVCNSSVKGSDPLLVNNIFHPYLKHPQTDRQMNFRFSFDLESHITAQSKIVTRNRFSKDSIDTMKLKEIYRFHAEEIRELIYLKKAYSDSYLKSLSTLLKSPVSANDVYRLAFGVYFEDEHLHKRPLSKLKKDILTELGIIK